MLIETIKTLDLLILWFFIILSSVYIVLLLASIREIFLGYNIVQLSDSIDFMNTRQLPPVTVIIPAYNEEEGIVDTVLSVLNSEDYNNISILIVNDGSTDRTLNKLIEAFDLYFSYVASADSVPVRGKIIGSYRSKFHIKMTVIDKENGQKSDALNVGVNVCRTPLFITLDADTLLESNAISTLVFEMLSKSNTVAVGGAVYVLNGCTYNSGKIQEYKMSRQIVPALQICEYLRSFLYGRVGWNIFGGTLCYAGAFTLFNHQTIVEVGGFDYKNVAQDFEIITHIQADIHERKLPCGVSYTAAAIAWTVVPSTLSSFWHQRVNWQTGSLQSLMSHKKMLFNPKYGMVGMFTYPFFLFGEILGAVVEFTAYFLVFLSWYFGILDARWVLLLFILCWGFVTCITIATTMISLFTFNKYKSKNDIAWVLLLCFIEEFGFRQYYVVCRTYASIKYFFNSLGSIFVSKSRN